MFKVTGRQNARVLYAKAQLKGGRTRQDDTLDHYLDECFVAADGVSTVPNGDIAARLGAETAVWGYKFIRTKRFYWHDKKLLLKRIFRSANIAVWQKARERAFRSGLATTLTVVIIGDTVIWTGHVGDSRVYLYRNGQLERLTIDDIDQEGRLTTVLGVKRFGLVPQVQSRKFSPGDTLIITTDGVTNFVSHDELAEILMSVGTTQDSLDSAATNIMRAVTENRGLDNASVWVVRRIA